MKPSELKKLKAAQRQAQLDFEKKFGPTRKRSKSWSNKKTPQQIRKDFKNKKEDTFKD